MINSNKNIYMHPVDESSIKLFALTFFCKLVSVKLSLVNLLNITAFSDWLSITATFITILVGITTLILNFVKIKKNK